MNTIDAMKQAVFAMKNFMSVQEGEGGTAPNAHNLMFEAITGLKESIVREEAQTVEPVAWLSTDCIGERVLLFTKPAWEPIPDKVEPLYLHPAPPAEPEPDEWKDAVLDELGITCIDYPIGTPPKVILRGIIEMRETMARDPDINEPTIKQSSTVHTSAEDYLRYKYGAYRGHPAWRELEEAYTQGRYDEEQAQGPNPLPECRHEWTHREQDQPWLVCQKCGNFLADTGTRPVTIGIDE